MKALMARANDSPYGLAAGLFTKDTNTGTFVQRNLKAGMVFWNCYHVVDIAAPFGMDSSKRLFAAKVSLTAVIHSFSVVIRLAQC